MSPVGFVQDHYPVQITAVLGENAVLVETMEGEESISGLYTFRLRLLSENASLAFDDIVGKDVALSKSTYPLVMGIEEARRRADVLVNEACGAMERVGRLTPDLERLARHVVERQS